MWAVGCRREKETTGKVPSKMQQPSPFGGETCPWDMMEQSKPALRQSGPHKAPFPALPASLLCTYVGVPGNTLDPTLSPILLSTS